MSDTWTFEATTSPHPLWRTWTLKSDHMTATFTAVKSRAGQHLAERYVTVTFAREITARTPERAARAFAMAEKLRFMAQAHDTIGDMAKDGEAFDLEIRDLPNAMATASCSLVGGDALTVGAVYFGNAFAEAVL